MNPTNPYETEVFGAGYSTVDPEYSGSCALDCEGPAGPAARVIFPNPDEARAAADFAIGNLGMYRAMLSEAPGEAPTHLTWLEWAY